MAWNPSPEVAAARDFGEKFGFDQVIILGLRRVDNQIGLVSYGRTKALCDDAWEMAQAAEGGVRFVLAGKGEQCPTT